MRQFDAVVVGAGIAGSTTALLLGQAGFQVMLVDRARFPRTKVCGEGLMPAGVKVLRRLGLEEKLGDLGARRFYGIRFRLPHGDSLELDFREFTQLNGWVVRRERLDALLLRRARCQPTVRFREGFNVRSFRVGSQGVEVVGDEGQTIRARVLIAADGIRSLFHRPGGVRRSIPEPRRFALRAFFKQYPAADLVEVFCRPGAEAYVAAMGRGARITLLLTKHQRAPLEGNSEQLYLSHLQQFDELSTRLGGETPQYIEATSPVALAVDRSHGERLLLVGDAGGAVDPLTGQGMSVAFRDAEVAAQLLGRRLAEDRLKSPDLAEFSHIRCGYFEPRFRQAQDLLRVVHHAGIGRRAARAVRRNRSLRRRLVCIATEAEPSTELSWDDRLRLAVGL